MPRLILALLSLGLFMAKDYKGTNTYRKKGCKGCCSIANSENKHVIMGIEHSSCGECDMTCHKTGCPER